MKKHQVYRHAIKDLISGPVFPLLRKIPESLIYLLVGFSSNPKRTPIATFLSQAPGDKKGLNR